MSLAPKPTPPFAALRAFHAVATHDRYRDAAATLGITESAVSHQVRKLEAFLQTALMDRSGPRAVLTDTGRRYFEQIDPAIRQIQAATQALLPASGRNTVRLTLPPSLATAWLIPKLGAFEKENADTDLQLITTTRVIDLRRDQADMAIRLGKGHWPGIDASFLLEETAMPVCAPGYFEQLGGEAAPGGNLPLQGARLIINGSFPDEWEEWARARGMPPPDLKGAITLDSLAQALQVAEGGHGVAMGRRPVVNDWLTRETLIAPFGKADPTGAGYYLCRAAGKTPTAAVRRLERWLQSVATA
ncbi:MAG: LysR substrate-binding domain-containing protein [Proteobacteria bacterium]|nr:LysR substrate-binding domain-containing protein [Pseudomonadota bacterium]